MRVSAGPNLHAAERPGPAQPSELVGPAGAPAQSRALVRLSFIEPGRTVTADHRPAAAFLAQLIATKQQAPQTRARRRAEPAAACAASAAALAVHAAARREATSV
jgi:hypothetical protein